MSKIPIFVSCPTNLNPKQEAQRNYIISYLKKLNMEARTLGRSDYPKDCPLREIYILAKHCSGGIILGFEQIHLLTGISKRGTAREETIKKPISLPSPWNHIESGILFGLKLPLLIFKESNITGGIFDLGSTDIYIHTMPEIPLNKKSIDQLQQVFLKWQSRVTSLYYDY